MSFPSGNKPFMGEEQKLDEAINSNAKQLEDLLKQVNWFYLRKAYLIALLVVVSTAVILIYAVRLALSLPVFK